MPDAFSFIGKAPGYPLPERAVYHLPPSSERNTEPSEGSIQQCGTQMAGALAQRVREPVVSDTVCRT
jgi:hypothetical protein